MELPPDDIRTLKRLVRGELLDVEADSSLSATWARELAATLRSATNGTAPVEALELALCAMPSVDGDAIVRALLADDEKPFAGTNFIFRTAREIARTTPERPEWIVHGLIARGAITEIDAKIKVGKTEFVARLVRAVLDGDEFLERATRPTPVVYLTEQSATTFREPLRRAGLLERDDLVVLTWHDVLKYFSDNALAYSWPAVAEAAIARCKQVGAGLLIVDGFSQFAGLAGDDENSSGKAIEAMRPLQGAAGIHGRGVVMARHDRKSAGDVGDSARGSSAFGGAVDIILALRRGEGNTRPSIRALHGLSRFDETPQTLMIELTAAGYVALGTVGAVAAKEARIAILDSAPQTQEHAVTEQELFDRAEVKRSTARPALKELVANGALEVAGAGKKNDPWRYWRPTGPRIHAVETPASSDRNHLEVDRGLPW